LDVCWHPSSSASTALSGHTIEKIEPPCSAYLVRTDPLPSIHFALYRSFIKQELTHFSIAVVREVVGYQRYGDDYRSSLPALSISFTHAVLRYGFFNGFLILTPSSLHVHPSIFFITFWVSIFLRFYHSHLVRDLETVIICSSHSPGVANEAPSRYNQIDVA